VAQTFNCPSCSAPLQTDGHETSIHCEYCGATVIVPPEMLVSAPTTGAQQPQPHPSQIEGPHGQLSTSQMRQMMDYIRAGQVDEAIKTFQEGTGANGEMAGQTVQAIASQLSASSVILPAALGAIMRAYAESASRYQAAQPTISPRRRNRGIGCWGLLAILLVIALVYFYFSFTALSPGSLVSSLVAGNPNAPVMQTAVAPFHAIATTIATLLK
jgi:DNA-directed RNA polymerase subunit RPC12/RpoP